MPLNSEGKETGWISNWAFQHGALSADARGREAVADGFVNTAKIDTGAVTAVKTTGMAITYDLGAPSVEAGALNDVLAAVALPAASTDEVHAAITLANGSTTVVVAAITNPDVPRSVAIIGNAAGIAGNVLFEGTDYASAAAVDTIALSGTTKVYGTTAFKTVTKITVPARTHVGDTVAVGLGRDILVAGGVISPDIPRSVGIKGSQAGVAGVVTITGTDYNDAVIASDITAVGDSKVYGLYAFKTITQVRVPALVGAGDTIVVGRAKKLAIPQLLTSANQVLLALLGRVVTVPTLGTSNTVLAANNVDLSVGTYDASKHAVVLVYN